MANPAMVAEAWAAWRAEIDFADQFIDEQADLSVLGPDGDSLRGAGAPDRGARPA